MIISASKRSDIPAFYGEWFMNNLRKGSFQVRNPLYPKKVSQINFAPEDIECIVFWTKNPEPFLKYLPEIKQKYHFYFTYSLNNYPNTIERLVPELDVRIETFKTLSKQIGSERTIWRYDPIFFTNTIGVDYHLSAFEYIASHLKGYTKTCIISVVDRYDRNAKNIDSIHCRSVQENELIKLIAGIQKIASDNEIILQSCAEDNLSVFGIKIGKCIDEQLMNRLFDLNLKVPESKEREGCHCVESVDIGVYNTCLHDCVYCYANYSLSSVVKNHKQHDKNSSMMIGTATPEDTISIKKIRHYNKKVRLNQLDFDDDNIFENKSCEKK